MGIPVGVWIDLDPEPVPIDDPRVRTATLVADGAWVRSIAPTTSVKIRDVVRAVLAHVDDLARLEKESSMLESATDVQEKINNGFDKTCNHQGCVGPCEFPNIS